MLFCAALRIRKGVLSRSADKEGALPRSRDASAPPDLRDNRLLAALPGGEFAALSPCLEIVHLDALEVIAAPGEPLPHAYFPLGGIISIVAIDMEGGIVEVGTIGCDGMAGLPAVLGLPASPFRPCTPCSCATPRPSRCSAGNRPPATVCTRSRSAAPAGC
jgi:hypothetical protein